MSRIALCCVALALACGAPKTAESPAQKYLRDPAAVERGHMIFVGTCGAYCHSTHDVERDAPSLFDCEWKHGGSDEEIFKTISNGVPNTRMPPWKGALPEGDDDIWKVIAYLRSATTCTTPAKPH